MSFIHGNSDSETILVIDIKALRDIRTLRRANRHKDVIRFAPGVPTIAAVQGLKIASDGLASTTIDQESVRNKIDRESVESMTVQQSVLNRNVLRTGHGRIAAIATATVIATHAHNEKRLTANRCQSEAHGCEHLSHANLDKPCRRWNHEPRFAPASVALHENPTP